MSLYPDKEITVSVYHPDDSDSTKKTSYPATADFTILMFIIRRGADAIDLMGAEMAEYAADVNGTYTNAGNIRQGDKIVADGSIYFVENKPKYVNLFNKYKILLRAEGK